MLVLAAIVGVLLAPRRATAIPAFARRYETACSTCHAQFPRLNQYGEAFRRNGYQLPDHGDADGIKQEPIPLVPEERRALLPNSDFPSDLAFAPPIATILRGLVPMFPDPKVRPKNESALSFDRMLMEATLVAGARAFEDVSFFSSMTLTSTGGFQFERGFVAVSNILPDGLLNVRMGQFEPQVLSFSNYRRVAGPKYAILNKPGKNFSFTFDPAVRGVDFNGILAGRVGYNLAWVQGIEPLTGPDPRHQLPLDGYLHLYGKIGGDRLDGKGAASTRPVDTWLTIGGFGYIAKHQVDVDKKPDTLPEADSLYKIGGDVNGHIGTVDLLVATVVERHQLALAGVSERIQGLAEANMAIFPWLLAGIRAEGEAPRKGKATQKILPLLEVYPRINVKAQLYAQFVHDAAVDQKLRAAEIDLAATAAF